MLKLVLHGLCHQWLTDTAFMSHDHSPGNHLGVPGVPYAGTQSRITLKKWLTGKRGKTLNINKIDN